MHARKKLTCHLLTASTPDATSGADTAATGQSNTVWRGASSTVEDEKEKNTIGGDPKIWAPIVGKRIKSKKVKKKKEKRTRIGEWMEWQNTTHNNTTKSNTTSFPPDWIQQQKTATIHAFIHVHSFIRPNGNNYIHLSSAGREVWKYQGSLAEE